VDDGCRPVILPILVGSVGSVGGGPSPRDGFLTVAPF
jgi:hypothetical protein